MAVWGIELYQDDVAEDVRSEFKDLLRKGKTAEEITKQMYEDHACVFGDPDDEPVFWFALADTQWNLGRLLPEVKTQAIAWLDKGGDLERWKREDPKLAAAREKILVELRQRLDSMQPPEKKISQNRLFRCEWKIGDVFAYQLESNLAKENGLLGRHLLFQKVDEYTWHPGHIIPVVYIKITKDESIPATIKEFDCLEYIQVSVRRYEPFDQEFRPKKEKNLTEEEYLHEMERIKKSLVFDEYGYLPVYRIKIINTSKRVIPSKLVFIGNYLHTKSPAKEFIPQNKIELGAFYWEKFNKTIEMHLIENYCDHNLRQSKIYQNE